MAHRALQKDPPLNLEGLLLSCVSVAAATAAILNHSCQRLQSIVSVSPKSDSLAARRADAAKQMSGNERADAAKQMSGNERANTVNENAAIHRDLKDTTAVIKIRYNPTDISTDFWQDKAEPHLNL